MNRSRVMSGAAQRDIKNLLEGPGDESRPEASVPRPMLLLLSRPRASTKEDGPTNGFRPINRLSTRRPALIWPTNWRLINIIGQMTSAAAAGSDHWPGPMGLGSGRSTQSWLCVRKTNTAIGGRWLKWQRARGRFDWPADKLMIGFGHRSDSLLRIGSRQRIAKFERTRLDWPSASRDNCRQPD